MYRPISTTVGICCLGYSALIPYAQAASAVSAEAESVRRNSAAVFSMVEVSQALFGDKAGAISEMKLLALECSTPDWDGHGAVEIDPFVIQIAEDFLRALPDSIRMPEFAPEPDGAISLDWIESKHRMISVSIGKSFRLPYAWLDGSNRGYAVERFDGSNIPGRVLHDIQSIIGY